MTLWDLIFDTLEHYFNWQRQIILPGFENVSLYDFKIALFITGIVISGLISVVPNAAYSVGSSASEKYKKKRAKKDKLEPHTPEADAFNRANMMTFGDDDD